MPFFLNKNTPPEGQDLMEHLTKKYGAAMMQRFNGPDNPLDVAGRKVGITFNKARRVIPTMLSHRAVEWCNQSIPSKSDIFMEKLFESYFTNGNDVSQINHILSAAAAADIPPSDIENLKTALSSGDQFTSEVTQKANFATRNLGVSGVPFFMIEGPAGCKPICFSGAQPPDILAEQLSDMVDKFSK